MRFSPASFYKRIFEHMTNETWTCSCDYCCFGPVSGITPPTTWDYFVEYYYKAILFYNTDGYKALTRKKKKFYVLHELGYEMQMGFWETVSPSMGSLGTKTENPSFSLKVAWYNLSEIIKIACSI